MSRLGQTVRVRGSAGGVLSARFVAFGGTISAGGAYYIVWDAPIDAGDDYWDDIGITQDGASLVVPAGKYHVDAFAEIGPVGTDGDWGAYLQIMPMNAELISSEDSSRAKDGDTFNPMMAASMVTRMGEGEEIEVRVGITAPSSRSIIAASIELMKVG